jgi:hypothetical protein
VPGTPPGTRVSRSALERWDALPVFGQMGGVNSQRVVQAARRSSRLGMPRRAGALRNRRRGPYKGDRRQEGLWAGRSRPRITGRDARAGVPRANGFAPQGRAVLAPPLQASTPADRCCPLTRYARPARRSLRTCGECARGRPAPLATALAGLATPEICRHQGAAVDGPNGFHRCSVLLTVEK